MSGTAAEAESTSYEPADEHNGSTGYEDSEVPAYWKDVKQLRSGTGFSLVISREGKVCGTTDKYNEHAILKMSSKAPGEVLIRAKASGLYVAMNEDGKVYAEGDPESENIIWLEQYDSGWNSYLWKGNPEEDWYLGIKKSGKMKKGYRTKFGQRAVRFTPWPAYPSGAQPEDD